MSEVVIGSPSPSSPSIKYPVGVTVFGESAVYDAVKVPLNANVEPALNVLSAGSDANDTVT